MANIIAPRTRRPAAKPAPAKNAPKQAPAQSCAGQR